MKEEYIKKIIKLVKACNNIKVLDLIFQLLQKHSKQI